MSQRPQFDNRIKGHCPMRLPRRSTASTGACPANASTDQIGQTQMTITDERIEEMAVDAVTAAIEDTAHDWVGLGEQFEDDLDGMDEDDQNAALSRLEDAIKRHLPASLADILLEIEAADIDYEKRYPLVLRALVLAAELGYRAGIALDPNEPQWPVVYIELPTGQVSWHMPTHSIPYDGHTTEQKYDRCRAYAEDNQQ